MGYKHDRDEILLAAAGVAREVGLARLSFARVGERLGISDRTVVYYFPTKADLVAATIGCLGVELQAVLTDAFGDEPLPAADLLDRARPAMSSPDAATTIRLFFELVGLSASGAEPYADIAPMLLSGWIDWLTPLVDAPDDETKRAHATWVVASIDGLLLVHSQLGAAATADAVRLPGIR